MKGKIFWLYTLLCRVVCNCIDPRRRKEELPHAYLTDRFAATPRRRTFLRADSAAARRYHFRRKPPLGFFSRLSALRRAHCRPPGSRPDYRHITAPWHPPAHPTLRLLPRL